MEKHFKQKFVFSSGEQDIGEKSVQNKIDIQEDSDI